MKKMEISRVSSEELVNMFEESFEEQIAKLNDIGVYGVECDDRKIGEAVRMKVEITGLAGTPTIDQFRQGKVKGSEKVLIDRADIGEMTFHLLPKETVFSRGNDYVIIYQAE